VHPAPGTAHGTLVNALLSRCGASLSGIGGERRPGIVHRIDKDTSGLLVAAKTDAAHHGLAAQFEAHSVDRRYLALCHGAPSPADARLRGLRGDGWAERLAQLGRDGAPNYFGPQRFGRDNLAAALAWLPERRRRRLSRFRRGLYLSVLRSYLFNEVLAARVAHGTWRQRLPGDVCDRDGRPMGPLWGRGRSTTGARAAAVEAEALAPHAALCEALEHAGLRQDRRPLQLVPEALCWHREEEDLLVDFRLPAGAYATVLLAELAELEEPERAA